MRKKLFLLFLFLPFLRVNPLLAFDIAVIRTEKATILTISNSHPIKYRTLISKDPPSLRIEFLDAGEKVPAKKWLIKEGGIEEIKTVHQGMLGFIGQKNFVYVKFTDAVLPHQIFPAENLITVLIKNALSPKVRTKKPERKTVVPQKKSPKKVSKSHIVKSGENLYRIAKKYHTTANEIQEVNRLHSNLIFAGQRLIVPQAKREIKKAPRVKKREQKSKTEEKTVSKTIKTVAKKPVSLKKEVISPKPKKEVARKKNVSDAKKVKTEPVARKKEKVKKKPLLTEGIVAVVNKEIIFESELDKEVKDVLERYGKEIPAEELKELKKEVLDKLIEDKIILQQAKREGIAPSREAIEELKNQLTAMTLIKKEVDSKIKVSEDEIKSFYQEHKEDFMQPAGVKISEILLSVPSTDEEGWEKAKIKMNLIKELLTNAESFAFLAHQLKNKKEFFVQAEQFYSEDKLPPQATEAIGNLKKGEASGIIKTEKGYKIIWIDERVPAQPVPLAIVKPEIEGIIFSQKREAYLKEWLNKLRKKSVIEMKED